MMASTVGGDGKFLANALLEVASAEQGATSVENEAMAVVPVVKPRANLLAVAEATLATILDA